jgi:hypothetical protein
LSTPTGAALFYPFHLCHERTLQRLLLTYETVHFQDFLPVRLSPLIGTTALPDRMGDAHPHLLAVGRLVQGHQGGNPLAPDRVAGLDRDLADGTWRALFHQALRDDRRFQRGLFGATHQWSIAGIPRPGPFVVLRLLGNEWPARSFTVRNLKALAHRRQTEEEGYAYEYAFALVKTAASLATSLLLCRQLGIEAVTDSFPHHSLLTRTCTREGYQLANRLLRREGY